ncbi:Toxoplasma gondii family C protein [Toxoplasma gondii RUB]|uniref:Toxoplasma gondii family C protein n=8 Tax=Toxoplasma gondii TaxID=5811 RepID=S7VNW4_TOXGG|nr:Toxoplasma gondii family C protein [Toxoplasma gondii GT1]KFG56698.1 Toxoplasma gondii family C protein [Toxoplasma gondii RUB]
MVNTIEKKHSGFPTAFQLPSRLKTRRGLLFCHDPRILLFSVAFCLTALVPFVTFECSTRRMCTTLVDSVLGLETNTDWSGTYSWTDTREGTTVGGDGSAAEADSSASELDRGATIESSSVESSQELSTNSSVTARTSRIQRSGRAGPIVTFTILASVILSIVLVAIFLSWGRKSRKATTPAPTDSAVQLSLRGRAHAECHA